MAILYADDPADAAGWAKAILAIDPTLSLRFWPDFGDPADIDFVIVGSKAPGDLRQFANLRAIQSTWAGVNFLLGDSALPPQLPLARMVDRGLTVSMTEYVAFHVLDHLRQGPRLRAAQRARQWLEVEQRHPKTMPVAILGQGVLGTDIAVKLTAMGFPVRGWSRASKTVPGVVGFAGPEHLVDCVEDAAILVCLLPLTDETRGILDRRVFAALAPGACLIHAARGAHLVEADLLEALAGGALGRAVIDVFATEPLPVEHPFWRHPVITVTPHVAAITRFGIGAEDIVTNYRRALSGQPLLNQVDRRQGY